MIYDISYKTLIGTKPSRIRFDKVDGFIRVYDWTTYLVLFETEKFYAILNRIRYLISQKSGIILHHFLQFCKIQSWFIWFFGFLKTVDTS